MNKINHSSDNPKSAEAKYSHLLPFALPVAQENAGLDKQAQLCAKVNL